MRKNKRKLQILLSFVFLFVLSFSFLIFNSSNCYAGVEELSRYTDVLEDLQKDEHFDLTNYPVDNNDYSLKIIQVAESNDKELFIYVYQPCSPNEDLMATCINMSLDKFNETHNHLYNLTLINSNGVFYKYKVKNFKVGDDFVRYYNIASIYRKWYSKYDTDTPNNIDNTISQVSFPVGLCYTAQRDDNGVLCYSCNGVDLVTITSKFVSYIRYTNGSNFLPAKTDSFYVAFKADRQMEKLMEADIEYITFTYTASTDTGVLPGNGEPVNVDNQTNYEFGPEETHSETLYSDTKQTIQVGYIFKSTYSWEQIESSSDFLNKNDVNFSSTARENVQEMDWVLNFYTASYREWSDSVGVVQITNYESGTRVKYVTILRLKFETDGVVYNLGVVDNMQNSTIDPSATSISLIDKIKNYIKTAFAILCLILVLIVLGPVLPVVLKIVFSVLSFVLKVIWWVISLPFKIFKKRR